MAWYALQTRAQHEQKTADTLAQQGFEVFYPAYEERVRWSDRQKIALRPLFPGYLFVRLSDPTNDARRVAGVRGAVRMLGVSSRPEPVDDRQITSIRRVVDATGRVSPHAYVVAGETVRVEKGPLEGLEGVVVRIKGGRCRLVLKLSLLRRGVAVEIDARLLTRVTEKKKTA